MQAVYDDMQLYVTGDRIFIEPVSPNTKLIVIDRVSHDVTVQDNTGQIPTGASPKHIYGVLGVISLLAGPYLVVVTGKSRVGTIAGQEIWKLDSAELICFQRTLTHLTDTQEQMNKVYISMVESVLATPYFFFSYTYDLTHSQQRLHNTSPEFLKMPLHSRADPRFLWNGHLLRQLPENPSLDKFLLPIMHGFISINSCSINGKPFTWSIVSRRSCHRAGTRLFMRGIDKNGNVANFVETEQIVESSGDRSSFVQTRGSIPLYWQQLPNLKYKPRPTLIGTENHTEAFIKHFEAQIMDYERQVLVNLVDHRGSEGEIEEAYKNMVNRVANPEIRYESFDFHHECRKMRWDRLAVLIDRLAHEQDEFGYFLLLRDGTLSSQQTGVFRTNCIDCLDRTNVVQSMLARRSLTTVLQRLAILRPGQTVEKQDQFEWLFKNVWADNADVISTQYSGTGALKTDFTRTGKRTYLGALQDLSNSVTRYYKNNFMDGFRQDSIDVFLGYYQVSSKECVTVQCPLTVNRGWKYITFPMIFCVAVAMFFANVITPTEYSTGTLLCLLFWGSMITATGATILYYGREFVDYPCLREISYPPQSQP
ncbi:phosphatidylinositol-3-phosphatase SAC1 [Macrosteles quadrilineatus]|uniref:phosphatidylinositol-3-phosphatase SAC1 n=1 Tax=Macrosteles quadrilineatus TaxID=74068 RepID=UPI0023E19FAC|nr:phosphatidylinositol-3-phosphatase SAC1 [Macrosteles quadrilineatus]